MVDAEARREIEAVRAAPSETRTLLVEFATDPALPLPGGSKRERLTALRQRHAPACTAWLQEFEKRGASVEPLVAGASLVVSAPVALWRDWVRPGGWLATEDGLLVRPTGRFEALR